jgi:hypothetical protein
MNFRFTVVEASLNRAEFRWKWLKFLRYSFVLGSILSLAVLVLGWGMAHGWVTSKTVATACFSGVAILGFISWAVIAITVAVGTADRNWLAAALERVDRRLMDRLNTLLFLERHRGDARVESFASRIARQTLEVISQKPSPSPFSAHRTLLCLLGFVIVVSVTVLVYKAYSPWRRLIAAEQAKAVQPARPDKPLELALPATNNVEQQQTWGEVRITDPGSDLRVTKVDVVPLQIEAAANQPLKTVAWFSTVNGGSEALHELAPPAEPRYAVYQPTVYLDELRLSDWDVMTYYAKANTDKTNSFASEVYFLEVRPFREDILKMPGGEGGKAYECLKEMSALIARQQHIIRQTHQHVQQPPDQETLQAQDRHKLSAAEADLGDSVRHLYAKMASKMENKPIGEALDNLAQAEKSLEGASHLLADNVMNEAQARERKGLAELIAARKIFQKAVSDNPKAFEEPPEQEPMPIADTSRKLTEMAEFRNEAKAAQEFVDKTLEQQRALERQAASAPRNDQPRLAEEEKRLQAALDDFQQQHPQVFKPAQSESRQAQQAMNRAASNLRQRSSEAQAAVRDATQQLAKLSDAMKNQATGRQLADAYKLKQMLDKQIQTLGQAAGADSKVSDQALQQTAGDARETVNALKRVAEQEPTRDAFSQPLRDALSGQNKVGLDAKLTQLQQAADAEAKQQRAGEAKEALSRVSKAFEASEPDPLQMAQQADPLKPDGRERFDLGLSELQSLIKQQEGNRQVSHEDQAKQRQEALFNLSSGLADLYGDNERLQRFVAQLQENLKPDAPIDVEILKKLMTELQHYSVETSDRLAKKEDKPEVTNIDPSRLPPAYRGRIQKYFQRLSEK